jgi:hypothetical protein
MASLEIQGKLLQVLPIESGTSKSGKDWTQQTIIVEVGDQYPKKIAIQCPEKLLDTVKNYQIGHTITCQVNIESREFNGKYFTSVKAWII